MRAVTPLMSALRQCEGVPEICVTPAVPARAEEIPDRLGRIAEHERARVHAAQKDLQPAVAADVIEGAPGRCLGRRRLSGQCAGQTFEGVQYELGSAGGARGEEDPLGRVRALPPRHRRRQLRPRGEGQRQADRLFARRIRIAHHGVRFGPADDAGQMRQGEIRGTQHQAARHAVELQQGQGGGQLVLRGEEHAAPAQFLEPAAEAGAVREVG